MLQHFTDLAADDIAAISKNANHARFPVPGPGGESSGESSDDVQSSESSRPMFEEAPLFEEAPAPLFEQALAAAPALFEEAAAPALFEEAAAHALFEPAAPLFEEAQEAVLFEEALALFEEDDPMINVDLKCKNMETITNICII